MTRQASSAARTTRFSEQLTRLVVLGVSVLAATGAVFGQAFKSAADLVTIPVTVTHRAGGERVRDLAAGEFRVFEEGVEQSGMDTRVGVSQIDWDKWKPSSNTALLDGLRQSLDLMDAAHNPRTAVLLVSDGGENASALTFADVVKTRRQSETLVYAFWVLPGGDLGPPMKRSGARLASDGLMNDVVGDSGGRTYDMASTEQAKRSAGTLLDDLQYQYLLGYSPRKPPDGKYRRVRVEMRNPDLRARARRGYLAVPR